MVRIVDEVLIQLGVDPKKWASGLSSASSASNKFFAGLKAHTKELAALTVASGLSLGAQRRFIEDVTKAAATQEAAVARLESALKSDQRTRKDSIALLTQQATALQKVTQFGDEQTITAQSILASFKLTDEQILKLIPRLQDLTTNLQKAGDTEANLENVSLALGRAIAGKQVGALSRYGLSIKLAKGETLDFQRVLDELTNSSFNGLAEAVGQTAAGRMKQFANAVDDVKESLGFALLPTIEKTIAKLTPLVTKFGEWVDAHQNVVLAIMGGGAIGTGLIAALGALGTAFAIFGASTGPVGLAILGVSVLVGWLIKLKLEAASMPSTLEDINAEIETQQKLANDLNRQINAMTAVRGTSDRDMFDPARVDELQTKLDAVIRRMVKLQEARAKLNQPAPEGATLNTGGGGGSTGAAATPFGDVTAFPAKLEEQKSTLENVLRGYYEITDETNQAIIDSDKARADAQAAILEQQRADVAQKTAQTAFLWGDMFGMVLQSESNFAQAFGKATVMALIKVINVEIRAAIGKILVAKATELGKAAIGAPLTFGATLAATGPIIAASALAIGALQAIEARVAKSLGGFEQGGVVPRTGHYLMHEGEVIYNPRKNTTAQFARNLARGGAMGEAFAVAGAGGGGMNVNFNGPIRSAADVILAMTQVRRDWQRALGSFAGG